MSHLRLRLKLVRAENTFPYFSAKKPEENMSSMKKKRVSKKLKGAWRKHVNINDVEEFLEEKRLEERLGPPLTTLTNDELFAIETKPDEKLLVSAKERKKLLFQKPLKCFASLEPHTKVPDPIKKRNRVRTKEERKNVLIKKKERENRAKGIFKPKDVQSIDDRRMAEIKRSSKPKRGDFKKDIWGDEPEFEIEKDQWANKNTKKHNLAGTGHVRKTVLNVKKLRSSVLPSIEPPHPGMSYNPSFEDHQNLLQIVADKENEIIKKERHLDRVTKNMFSKVTEKKRDSDWMEEMSQGLPSKSNETNSGEESDGEYKTINPPTKNVKKTAQQKRKQKEQRKLKLERKMLKKEKKKISDIHQLKTLHKVIEKTERKSAVLREKRKKIQALKVKEAKRLGSMKFEEAELDFNMGSDISGNLRTLKKEGNLLVDRFKSLQKRNVIEPSVRRHRRKSKVKKFVKPGHNDEWKKSVAR